jgi:hypothetical protein
MKAVIPLKTGQAERIFSLPFYFESSGLMFRLPDCGFPVSGICELTADSIPQLAPV